MDWGEIAIRLCIATVAGMLIGIDRELRHKPAGLRTHTLVTLSAASITLIALQLGTDGSRIIQGILTGIGFIGAGTILHSARHVEGITTAATIWTCTMAGIAAGAGYYKILLVTLALAIAILSVCLMIENAMRRKLK